MTEHFNPASQPTDKLPVDHQSEDKTNREMGSKENTRDAVRRGGGQWCTCAKELEELAREAVEQHTPPDMRDDSLLDLKQPLAIPPETRFWSQDTPEKKLRDGMRGKDGEFMVARMHWILSGLHDALEARRNDGER